MFLLTDRKTLKTWLGLLHFSPCGVGGCCGARMLKFTCGRDKDNDDDHDDEEEEEEEEEHDDDHDHDHDDDDNDEGDDLCLEKCNSHLRHEVDVGKVLYN